MEVAALAGLAGLGYVVSKYSGTKSPPEQRREGFVAAPTPMGGLQQAPSSPFLTKEVGSSVTAPASSLDLFFQNTTQSTADLPQIYASQRQVSPVSSSKQVSYGGNEALVEMRSDGFEDTPQYLNDNYITSPLSGQRISSKEFTHSNMTPFYGGSVKQNTVDDRNVSRLDTYTGAQTLQIKKQEVEAMFNTGQTPYGNPFGQEASADFVRSRINESRNRAGERPFEPIKVAPGVGERFGSLGKGGFQQIEVNEMMRPRVTDELRTANNPKLSYGGVVVPGQHYIGKGSDDAGEVRKYRPDRFYVDETGERFFVTNGEVIKETARPVQIMNHTTRPETSVEHFGPGQSQDFEESYILGSYRMPATQQYEGDMLRNVDMTGYATKNTDSAQADYGRHGFENRPNERDATSQRGMGLNLAPADSVAAMARYGDDVRPTRRAETIGNIRQTGTPVGYAGGVPATTVWDPTDVARTTVKEGTVARDWIGIVAPASAPTKLTVYDPEDIARRTQKETVGKTNYYGGSYSTDAQEPASREAYGNARLNSNKQVVTKRRKPIAGNGGLAIYKGDINQSARRPTADDLNDRALTPNVMVGLSPGVDDIGMIKYRAPLNLDISQRNSPDIISSVVNNPLQKSLHNIAQQDHTPVTQLSSGKMNPIDAQRAMFRM